MFEFGIENNVNIWIKNEYVKFKSSGVFILKHFCAPEVKVLKQPFKYVTVFSD